MASKGKGPNIREYLRFRNRPPQEVVSRGNIVVNPTHQLLGKGNDLSEETVKSNLETTGIGDRALTKRDTEITSGRSKPQQGLATTCKDRS